jgi:hypothetical protein
LNWDYLDYSSYKIEKHEYVSKPLSLEKMINYAGKLSKPFPYIRIDFYEIDGNPLFGEMTFTPGANIDCDFTFTTHTQLGKKLLLPKI